MFQPSTILSLLRRTQSDFDGEALACIRKANGLLEAAGLDWADFFDAMIQVQAPPPPPEPEPEQQSEAENDVDEIHRLFVDLLSADLPKSATKFVNGVWDYWTKHGKLSKKQLKALRNSHRWHISGESE